ncbi:hypothetical protein SADUNF_Sadunf13G0080300 [Salix dunnii]|uniref:DNA2/NAM7 helicase-like C-terminal domain-containing protein n=1 Tax=Salix dunnii TaxID=1413687 RepID=A0A835JJQ7_9ROSI|nr:hypothetical protein SADUNF_Sadunf13G0080300 [Salix dunnii]
MNVRLKAAVELLRFFKRRYSSEFVSGRIGIITPYKAETNQNWAALVKDAKERNLVISAKQPYESLFETAPRGACKRESINSHSRLSRHAENSRGNGKLGK